MKRLFGFQTMGWCLLWILVPSQTLGLASTVKVLVSPGQKQQMADLEKRLPNLELVAAGRGEIAGLIGDCDAIIGLPYGNQGREDPAPGKEIEVGAQHQRRSGEDHPHTRIEGQPISP